MNTFEQNQNMELRRPAAEGREIGFEVKEKSAEEQEKKMAARERAEQMGKEVQNTQKQMQNIMANMQAVLKAVRAIRVQLGLTQPGGIPSVEKDKKTYVDLQGKLKNLRAELSDLKRALLQEEITQLTKDLGGQLDGARIEELAKQRVAELLRVLGAEGE